MAALPFYLGPDGTLTETEPTAGDESATRYDFDASLAEKVTLEGDNTGDAFLALPGYSWDQEPDGSAAVFVSPPLEEDLTLAGPASADLWIRSSTEEADIGVTLSEVRPDGKETYIQSGVLRGTMRKPGPDANELWPAQTGYAGGRGSSMPVGEFTEARWRSSRSPMCCGRVHAFGSRYTPPEGTGPLELHPARGSGRRHVRRRSFGRNTRRSWCFP
ncbi:MAG: hypothetical protein M9922_00165 [Microthrixaceae bacterium]|nr:hypothetical protein [Microthrixaceae bacterium]